MGEKAMARINCCLPSREENSGKEKEKEEAEKEKERKVEKEKEEVEKIKNCNCWPVYMAENPWRSKGATGTRWVGCWLQPTLVMYCDGGDGK